MGAALRVFDYGLLDSAVARPGATAFGIDAYPDIFTKAAALLQSLARNHPLVDGFDVDSAEEFVVDVATGEEALIGVISAEHLEPFAAE